MIWYVINALSRSYSKLLPWVNDPNWLTTLMSLISIGLFFAFSIDMIQNNISDVSAAAPEYKRNFDALNAKIIQQFNLQDLPNVNQIVGGIEIAPLITALAGTFTNMISDIFIVLIYVLFLMLEQGTFQNKISAMFPDNIQRGSILSILAHAQEDIQTYLWIKTVTSLITGLVSYFILMAVGVDFAGFWAFTIFLLNFIPTIGSIIATLFPALLTLIQFDTFAPFLIVLLGVGSVQIAVGNFLEPKLMGTSLNVSPLVVMLSLTLWGSVWGVAGMFLSVPITVMMLIVFAHFKQTRHWAIMLSGNGSVKFAEQSNSESAI
jgi:predicted PurR-regulated permease PerM